MKKIIYSLLTLSLVLSCSDTDDHGVDVNNFDGIYFVDGTSDYLIDNNGLPKLIELGSTMTSSSDRTFTIEIDESSTAVAGVDYDLTFSSVTIPAGSSSATFAINGNFEAATPEGVTLKLYVSDSDMTIVYDMGIFQYCVSDIAGTYSVTTTYAVHDFLPTDSVITQDMEIVDLGDGKYSVSDFSGGLYEGIYDDNYGTGGLAQNELVFSENCGLISWTGQIEPFGPLEMLDGGTNGVDGNGVVTISWYCPTWGEEGVSVYTPL